MASDLSANVYGSAIKATPLLTFPTVYPRLSPKVEKVRAKFGKFQEKKKEEEEKKKKRRREEYIIMKHNNNNNNKI